MSSPCGKCNTCSCSGHTKQPAQQEQRGKACGPQPQPQQYQQVPCPTQQQSQQPQQQLQQQTRTCPAHQQQQQQQPQQQPQVRTCPAQQQAQHQQYQQYQQPQHQQQITCTNQQQLQPLNYPSNQQQQPQQQPNCQVQQQQPQASKPCPQTEKRNRVECRCAPSRDRRTVPVQAPLADTYTCLRPRTQPTTTNQPICTCKQMSAPATCECAPPSAPPVPPPVTCNSGAPPTHAYIACGTPTNTRRSENPCSGAVEEVVVPQYKRDETKQKRQTCSHCQSQAKQKKKCIIQ